MQTGLFSVADKFKRTALIHACQEGAAHVASYLLARGANPNVADSSGNTALHYAAAYGWFFCVKVPRFMLKLYSSLVVSINM